MTEAQIQTLKALYEDYKKHLYDNSHFWNMKPKIDEILKF